MPSLEVASTLIGEIYDAALEPERWPNVLERICGFVKGALAVLFWQDSALKTGGRYFSWNDNPPWTRLYFEKYIKYNPLIPGCSFTEVGTVTTARDLMSWEDMRETLFYKEWLAPQGFVDNVYANLERSGTSYAMISITCDERTGPDDEEIRRRLSLLVPHIRRAVLIGKVFEQEQARSAAFAEALDGLAAAVLLLDPEGRLLHVNRRGQELLDQGDPLTLVNGLLRARDRGAQQVLRDVLPLAGAGDEEIGSPGIAIPIQAADGTAYLARILPLGIGTRRGMGQSFGASTALFIHRASLDVPNALDALRVLYRLTASEVRVLDALIQGGGVARLAMSLGIAEATVKNHLHSLFQKTGTRRQADLVRLAAAHRSPAGP